MSNNTTLAKARSLAVWLLPALVVAIAVARVSVWIQPRFAPLVLYPLLLGAALGAFFCGLAQLAELSDLRLLMPAVVICVLVAAAAEHVFFYLDHSRQLLSKSLEAGIPEEVISRPTFTEFLQRQTERNPWKRWLWFANAALMILMAGGAVGWIVGSRRTAVDHQASSPEPREEMGAP